MSKPPNKSYLAVDQKIESAHEGGNNHRCSRPDHPYAQKPFLDLFSATHEKMVARTWSLYCFASAISVCVRLWILPAPPVIRVRMAKRMGSLDLPTTTGREVLLRNKRRRRHIKVLSYARQLRVCWVIHGHIARPASAGGIGFTLQRRRAQVLWGRWLSFLVCIT